MREEGFYWVKLGGEWIAAEYEVFGDFGLWSLTGESDYYEDSDFEEIDETMLLREEK